MIWKVVLLSSPVLISSRNKVLAGPTSNSPADSTDRYSAGGHETCGERNQLKRGTGVEPRAAAYVNMFWRDY